MTDATPVILGPSFLGFVLARDAMYMEDYSHKEVHMAGYSQSKLYGNAFIRQQLMASPMRIAQVRALLARRGGLMVSAMSDGDVVEHIEQHGHALLALGTTDCDCSLGEKMTQIMTVGPLSAGIAKLQADEARTVAEKVVQERGWPVTELSSGRADAFRHCYWSCVMTKAIGVLDALKVGETHECCVVNSSAERAMDLHNNMVGRSLGAGASHLFKGDCKNDCLQAVENGQLILRLGSSPTTPTTGGY